MDACANQHTIKHETVNGNEFISFDKQLYEEQQGESTYASIFEYFHILYWFLMMKGPLAKEHRS